MDAIAPFILAGLVTFFSVPVVMRLARKFKLVDDPRVRFHPAHTHRGIIPRAGGLALFLGISLSLLAFVPLTKLAIGIIVGSFILMIMGLADDHKDVNPYVRLLTNAVAALIVVGAGAGIPFFTNPLTGTIVRLDSWRVVFQFFGTHSILVWADLFAFVWIMWTMNIVGWSAGVDGQMPGFVAISAFVLGLLSMRYSSVDANQIWVTILAFIVCGSFLGFLPWNMYPQKIMPGYGGKTIAGFFLALLSILSFGKLGTALLVLGIPMVDAASTLIRRVGRGKSPVVADRGHLHHLLLDLGWGKRRVALFYWGVSAILGLVSLTVNSRQKVFALLLVIVLVAGLVTWLNFFTQFSKPQDPDNG
ncbi:undecaprenyl/decaprenyl-phosphate alpha-N-acetylglucosaminyl 1-phosphate transferase [Candidatus Gottesmanbacteria bacterium]|nr:undecaprenyl/decaprenyl-phosphate alpha-N-acetylglucosaminyl 1-phosphate transferase [Candidatus Gottesmanbacteria bacterium]